MASYNKVILMGNVSRDPQVKYLPSGTAVCELGLGINSSYKDKDGKKVEEVTFVDCTFFGKTAEVCGEYLAKGRPVLVEGRLKLETWDDRATGTKRSKLKVIGEEMRMLGSKPDGAQRRDTSARDSSPRSANQGESFVSNNADEVPF